MTTMLLVIALLAAGAEIEASSREFQSVDFGAALVARQSGTTEGVEAALSASRSLPF